MRCLAVCQDVLVIRMLDEILLPGFEVEFVIESRPLARRLQESGVTVTVTVWLPRWRLISSGFPFF